MQKDFDLLIDECKTAILEGDTTKAEKLVGLAFELINNSPKVHNILGIIAEVKNDKTLAISHYRAALGLDASYKPAIKNLEKMTTYGYYYKIENLYFD